MKLCVNNTIDTHIKKKSRISINSTITVKLQGVNNKINITTAENEKLVYVPHLITKNSEEAPANRPKPENYNELRRLPREERPVTQSTKQGGKAALEALKHKDKSVEGQHNRSVEGASTVSRGPISNPESNPLEVNMVTLSSKETAEFEDAAEVFPQEENKTSQDSSLNGIIADGMGSSQETAQTSILSGNNMGDALNQVLGISPNSAGPNVGKKKNRKISDPKFVAASSTPGIYQGGVDEFQLKESSYSEKEKSLTPLEELLSDVSLNILPESIGGKLKDKDILVPNMPGEKHNVVGIGA